MIDIIVSILAAIISIVAFLIGGHIGGYFLRKKRAARREVTQGERIQQSISKLSSASQEIDTIIKDIVQDIKHRQTVLEELKAKYQTLSQEKAELSKQVEMLKDTQPEVAKYFEQTLQQMEKKRARRDSLMFALGIVVTTVIAILLGVLGVG
ncbi:MAG TPA: hypothetical protein VMW40_08190 [Candidatus Bathyarchaeia archaeon]|nr:hypothetical protein [Candidatus Bathyarchaeia archaeon]